MTTLCQMHFTGNNFLFKTITAYLRRILRGQKLEQPSILVTASTRKAARNINGTTLHFAFHLPVKQEF